MDQWPLARSSRGRPTMKAGTMTNPPFGMLLNWDGPDRINNNPFVNWLKLASEWQTSGNLQLAEWESLQAARTGATGRGAQDFIGSYDIAEAG